MSLDKKETAPYASVGADAGQPLQENINQSIPEDPVISNDMFENFELMQQELYHMTRPSYLRTVSMNDLYETVYPPRTAIIENLLYPGTYLFVGAPKLGKSFLMAQLAYHVSTGTPFWDYPVRKGTVLYLALEDDYNRLQRRLYRMFEENISEKLRFATDAKQLGNGLIDQIKGFVTQYPDTGLIIIDTLQKIRESAGERYLYGSEYDIIGVLKQLTDQYNICLLLVHHTRKQKAEDKFEMISGTNGLAGAADGMFLMHKEERTSNDATIDISGRDQQDQRLYLKRNIERLTWCCEKSEVELWKNPPDPVLEATAKIVSQERPEWKGSPTELLNEIGLDMKANVLSQRLNVNAGRLFNEHRILYENGRTHTGRMIKLTLVVEKV